MRWPLTWLLIAVVGCVAPSAPPPQSAVQTRETLRDEGLYDHEIKEELRWAEVPQRSAAEWLEIAEGHVERREWTLAYEAASALVEGHPDTPEFAAGLWLLGSSAHEVSQNAAAERALTALLCTEAAPSPVLEAPHRIGSIAAARRCTPAPLSNEVVSEPSDAWLLLGLVLLEESVADAAMRAFEEAIGASQPGDGSRAHAQAVLARLHLQAGDWEQAFVHAASLATEGGESSWVDVGADVAAAVITDDDWNGDGRKDNHTGLSRPTIARWLRAHPEGATSVIRIALRRLVMDGHCRQARQLHGRLAQVRGGGRAAAQQERALVRTCATATNP